MMNRPRDFDPEPENRNAIQKPSFFKSQASIVRELTMMRTVQDLVAIDRELMCKQVGPIVI